MAITRKTRNFLPSVFQTDTNEKFLSATMDQLISEPTLTNLYGYIGRKFAPTFRTGDSYITESSADRQDYQLESSVVVRNDQNNVTFFSSYVDYVNKLKYYGAITDNQSRLFDSEYYSFDPRISFDKFVNFSQYYWLPDGPDPVTVDTTGLELDVTYNVSRDVATGQYIYTNNGVVDNSVILPRGGVYKFVIDQPGYPFWIQTELGVDGTLTATPTLSSRDVLGVENNGTDSGIITFTIPQKTAQDRFTQMSTVGTIDYATPARFSDWENKTVTQFQSAFPQWNGITGQLNGKQLIFVSQDQYNNEGDVPWTVPDVIDPNTGNVIPGYDAGTIISDDLRYGIWQVQLLDIGLNDPLIRMVWVKDVNVDQKVYIRYGLVNGNKEYYKDYDGFFHQQPLLSSLLDTLFAQDGVDANFNDTFKVVDYAGWIIDVENDILGQQTYTSPNGVEFTSGLKIEFDVDVMPASYQNRQFYVEGVGDLTSGIILVPVDELVTPELYNDENALNYPDKVFPEYITINRASIDRNPWSRNNRWFHRQVITDTAGYRGEIPIFDQKDRAQRPIIQFDADLLLFNNGRIGKYPVDILDTATNDAFTQLEGEVLTTAFGVTLFDGMRVIFAGDQDPLVRNKIYTLKLVQYTVDPTTGIPTGPYYIKLVKADDGDIETYDTVVVKTGQYKGSQWWYDGIAWLESQQKTATQQDPLFDVYNSTFDPVTLTINNGRSLSQITRSNFTGTKLFGYLKNSAGVTDPVLGFALSYRNFSTQGDIEFQNYFSTDTYNYANDLGNIVTENISTGFLQKIQDRYTLSPKNTWQTVLENSKQYQEIGYIYDGTSNIFPIDVTPNDSVSIPYVKVFKNFRYLTNDQWVLVANQIRLTTSEIFIGDGYTSEFLLTTVTSTVNGVLVLVNGIARKAVGTYSVTGLKVTFYTAPKLGDKIDIRVIQNPNIGDKIDILVYSDEISKLGFYEVPLNLDLNAQNIDVNTLTLGQLRNHLVQLGQNSTTVVGNILGVSNLRDIDIKQQGGTILQHSAPVPTGELFLLDDQANFVDGLRYAQKEYTKFKNKFLELSASLVGIDPTDPIASVDLILTEINKIKNSSFPWFYSDMVPYGTLKNTIVYTVYDPLHTDYELTNIFNDQILSNQAVLVYLNGRQLIKGLDFEFLYDRPAVRFITTLEVNDTITIVEYVNTDGAYIPETPTKIGLWPRFIPTIFFDDTYRTPINVIRGHDGSITPAFDDYRDNFLIELELRIFNNIKLPDTGTYGDIFATIPGKYRKSDYTIDEMTQLVSSSFQSWIGNNKLDFSTNSTFESNDPFTWNYGAFNDIVDLEPMRGSWRAVYQYFYDTFYPHKFPWEMLGFAFMPDWWESYYGPGPYTSGNKLLWSDLEGGIIREGYRSNGQDSNGNWIPATDVHYQRPGLASIIPVDENGNLLPPINFLTASYAANRAAGAWAVGQYGPVEYAWRTSSEFPYAVQQAIALAKPGRYFSLNIDTYTYSPYNPVIQYRANASYTTQYLIGGVNHHIRQTDILYNGQPYDGSVYRGAGYLNWIADYLISQGVNPSNKITMLLHDYQVNLAYKLAGFTDKSYLNVLAEQTSPGSTNDTIVIPNENYKVHLNKSTPVQKLIYSAVIVEKTTNGYSVRGYDLNNPFFTIIPSVVNSNATQIKVLNSTAAVFRDYQNLKLTVPYGYEFTSGQQIVDFLISYERYLMAQGFTFTNNDDDLGKIRDWKLSCEEFLYWSQQGWKPGSILVLSPVANVLNAISVNAITDGISDSQYGSRVVDQNFKLVRNIDYDVTRSSTNFKLTLTNSASVIGYVEVDLVQYEHVLIFDNTTVFNDIIYKPELGNRQYRLKLQGQKTANWDGSLYAPGFIYSSGDVSAWEPGQDYLQGDLIEYKNQYYTALQNVIASADFQFNYWQQINSSQIQTGLLPNFSTLAAEGKAYYDDYPSIDNKKQIEYSHGLIGYRPRQYLADLGLTQTTQIEFYKGYIKQKGTFNAINQLTKAEFNNLTSNISLYEEWAIRLGSYGALDSNPYVEIALDEKKYGVNPSLAEFVYGPTNSLGNGETIFNESQLYKSTDQYNGNIALNRTEHSNYENDILTAGYVNLDDIDATIFDLAEYTALNDIINQVGTGYTIWCAKDFSQQWNVYRITETNNFISNISVTANTVSSITFTSVLPHKLSKNDIFIVQGFSTTFDGFYQVNTLVDLNRVTAAYTGNTGDLPLAGYGILYVLNSMRFRYMEDCRVYGQPPNQWKVGEKIWIDDDAATNAVQGQPYGTQPSGTWKVYEKHHPWNLKQALPKAPSEYATNDGYGTSVKMSADGLIVVTGSPNAANASGNAAGTVNTFFKDYTGEFVERFNLSPTAANTYGYGSTVDLSADSSSTNRLAVGAPASYGNVGYVFTYSKGSDSNSFGISQVLVGDTTNPKADKFGTSIAFNQDGNWLYVGAPGNDKVYIYGLNKFIPTRQQTISVNNQNIVKLTGNIRANVGDTFYESITGATATVTVATPASYANIGNVVIVTLSNANIRLNSLTNILTNAVLGNITLDGNITANVGQWVTQGSGANMQVFYTPTLNSRQVVGYLKSVTAFNTTGNVYVNGVDTGVKPTFVGSANIFLNGSDTGLYVSSTYTLAYQQDLTLGFTPAVANDARSLLITIGSRTFIPDVEYTLSGTVLHFTDILTQGDVRVVQQPYYVLLGNVRGNSGSNFGYALSSSFDGAQLAVGAPLDNVLGYQGAGSVLVFDRVIEAFNSTGYGDYTTQNLIGPVHRVTIDNVEVDDYFVVGNVEIQFSSNITAAVGDHITQIGSAANAIVITGNNTGNTLTLHYTTPTPLNLTSGNVVINGTTAEMYSPARKQIYFNGNISANIGDHISQTIFVGNVWANANAVVVANSISNTVTVSYLNANVFTLSANITLINGSSSNIANVDVQVVFSGNITANVGQTISQDKGSGNYANAVVISGTNYGNTLSLSYANVANIFVLGSGNVSVNGSYANVYPATTANISAYPITSVNYGVYPTVSTVVGINTVRFTTPPPVGKVIYVEVNTFTLLEKLIGINSLEGGTAAIQANAFFGTSLTICSNNCAIYIGAPNYDNGTEFNTGAVWKFHNRGRLYGTNNGYTYNPVFYPGNTIRLDNFEITVNGRLMPTTNGNILTLNSNVTAHVGDYITQSGSTANLTVVANVVNSRTVTVTGNWSGLHYGLGNVIAVTTPVWVSNISSWANVTVSTSAYPLASLDSLIKDINDANLLGISAVNENNRLRLKSDSTVAKNLLRILAGTTQPGTPSVYASADLIVFAFMQIIINPYQAEGEYFGSKVKLAANAYMLVIGSARGTTRGFATFDNDTTYLDQRSTRMFDHIQSSGSVYIYELYDDPRNEVEHPGRYAFAQQLNPGDLNTGDQFGYALDIEGQYITISAPTDDTVTNDAGTVYIFENPALTRGWKLIRYQQPKVDIDSVTRMYLYSTTTNIILDNLQFIDPAKGRILGQAEQEITYKTDYDPAIYNRGNNPNADINANLFWNDNQVGQVWWNLSMVRFIDYEQDTLTYRSRHWGELFPGSVVEVLEWVESTVLPSEYVKNGGDGRPKYADNSAYVEIIFVDPVTNIITSKYYYWVINKTSVDPNNPTRSIPIASISDSIANPKSQGIAYAAVIQSNAVILYNIGSYLSAKNTVLHIDYQLLMNTNIIHSEYQLLQRGNPNDFVPDGIVNKLVDSLAGIDRTGAVVPDPKLSVADSYGIDIRPRQSMFIDRLAAVYELISYVNSVLINKPIAREYSLVNLNSAEPEPSYKLGEYDRRVATEIELQYIDIAGLPIGYKILVATDTSQDGLWVLYQLTSDYTWQIIRVQSYKTNLYWNYVDWFDFKPDGTRYSLADKLDYVVPTLTDAKKLAVAPGEEILVRVNNSSDFGGWSLLIVNSNSEFQVVGIQNGTIQFQTSLGDFATNELGFGNQGYSTDRYDQNPNIEIRNIIYALKNDIFINELLGEFNKTFFVMVNYLFSEQKYIDWIFKTSFISATHNLRTLSQFPSYIKDNQTYYQSYIDEVKPYRTKLREYLLNYTGNDEYPSTVTDFDLPPYYDTTSKIFRSPSGEIPDTDEALWQIYPYNQWYENRKLIVDTIIVENPGEGYTVPPTVTVVNGEGGGAGATATAYINGNTGAVTHITVTSSGKGYITTPTVVVNGSCTIPATAYAVIKNHQVRSFDTTLKFDRITYTSSVKEWTANTAYIAGDIITYAISDGNTMIRKAYTVNANITTGNSFISTDYTVFAANAFTNANDRIIGYYQPTNKMPARDLNQLIYGIDYPGVQVQGPLFNESPLFGGTYDVGTFDNVTYDQDGNPLLSDAVVDTIIQSTYGDAALGTRAEDINVDGGAYVDRYSSHAPEEMVPGIVFDTLDMRVFTQANAKVYGYRIFNNMLRETSYIRISDNQTTTLANALSISDTTITVANVQVLPTPDPTTAYPGVVFIGAERITYWTSNVATNTLGQIRRGTQGTSVANTYPIGTLVTDASHQQIIPATVKGNVKLAANTAYTVTDIVSYTLQLSNSIQANVGDTITQYASGASATVLSFENSAGNLVLVNYNNTAQFNFLTGNVVASSNVAINGQYTGNAYPISSNIAGKVNSAGNITVTANTVLQTANIWLNLGANIATDGTGLDGATTVPALFIKAELAILNSTNIKADELITEDAINMLSTEDGTVLTEE